MTDIKYWLPIYVQGKKSTLLLDGGKLLFSEGRLQRLIDLRLVIKVRCRERGGKMRCKMRWLGCKSAPCNKRRPQGTAVHLCRDMNTNTVQIQNSRMQNAKCACIKRLFPGENAHNAQYCQCARGKSVTRGECKRLPGERGAPCTLHLHTLAQTIQCCKHEKRQVQETQYTSVSARGMMQLQWTRSNAQYTCASAKGAPRGEKSHVLRAPSLLHCALRSWRNQKC